APDVLLLALLAWAATSLAWSTNPALGLPRVMSLVGLLGLVRAVRAEVTDVRAARRWLQGLLLCGVLAVALDAVLTARARPALADAAAKHASQLFVHNNMAASFAV